ncbi:MAG: PIN domain-containing protein [Candidatus Saccharimonadaceae bacterium]
MENFILVIVSIILIELTYLTVKQSTRKLGSKGARNVFIDTSVIMDGRIVSVVKSGFLGGDTLVIPRSVIGELQLLADSADHDKRERARAGLDIVSQLQNETEATIEILQDSRDAREGVDNRLLALAKQHGGALCTIDYNLQKVAIVEGIPVLSVNELAQSLRMSFLPGEKTMIDLQQKGHDSHQAVGYLPDGTMVVVENASGLIGQTAEVEFTRALQTAAGRMMFARLVNKPAAPKKQTAAVSSGRQPQVRPSRTNNNRRDAQPKQPTKPQQDNIKAGRPQSRKRVDREDRLIELVNKTND